jgi:hypothetical protein
MPSKGRAARIEARPWERPPVDSPDRRPADAPAPVIALAGVNPVAVDAASAHK